MCGVGETETDRDGGRERVREKEELNLPAHIKYSSIVGPTHFIIWPYRQKILEGLSIRN